MALQHVHRPARPRRAQPRRTRPRRDAPAAGAAPLDPRFARVVAAFASDRRVTTGTMMASVGLKVGGRIFAMLVRGQLVAKLPRERVDALVAARLGARFDPRRDGRLMKEWVVLEGDAPDWVEVAREAYRFVSARG